MGSFLNQLYSIESDAEPEDYTSNPPSRSPKASGSKAMNNAVTDGFDVDFADFNMGHIDEEPVGSSFHTSTKKKKHENGTLEDLLRSTADLVSAVESDDGMNDFGFDLDDSIDDLFSESNNDTALANNLIMQGRAYARKNGVDAELGEVEKAFAPQERLLQQMLDAIDRDAKGVQRDIDDMRSARSRSMKSMADLVSAKASMTSTKLSIIKEINSMRKTVLDVNMKLKAAERGVAGSEDSEAQFAVQTLLNNPNIMGSVGGLSSVSGAVHSGEDIIESVEDQLTSDDQYEARYLGDLEESEGDRYIKYENSGVKLHLQIDQRGGQTVVAIDKDGNEVPDYPLPPNVGELKFSIHDDLGTATDQVNRDYIVDRI